MKYELIAEQTGTADGPRVKTFRGVTPCSFTYVNRRFGETHLLHVQVRAPSCTHTRTHTYKSPLPLNFVLWRPIFIGSQFGTSWRLQ
jgi:hypothetical protein